MKTCSKCKIPKEEIEFYRDGRKRDGLTSWCKICHNEDSKKREPKYKDYRDKYRELNKDANSIKKRLYYQINKKDILEESHKWRQTIKGRLASYRRGATKRNIEWFLTEEDFLNLWNKNCFYCGDVIKTIGIDRKNNNEGYKIDNVVPCCSICNKLKLALPYEDFIKKIKQIYENGNI